MAGIPGEQRGADIVNDHLADLFGPMLLMQQILTQCRGGDFWYMFVLGNGGNFRWGQAAKRDTVCNRNHKTMIAKEIGEALIRVKAFRRFGLSNYLVVGGRDDPAEPHYDHLDRRNHITHDRRNSAGQGEPCH